MLALAAVSWPIGPPHTNVCFRTNRANAFARQEWTRNIRSNAIPAPAQTIPFVIIEKVYTNVRDCFAARAPLIGPVTDAAAALQLIFLTVQTEPSVRPGPVLV